MRAARTHFAVVLRSCLAGSLALLFLPGLARGGTEWWSSVGPDGGRILALAVDPISPNVLYAGGVGGVLKTLDGGARWILANNNLPAVPVFALAIDPKSTSTLYAGTKGGVYKSTDAGASWSAANEGLSGRKVFALALDPSTPSTAYAGTDAGVFKSVDGGSSWTAASNGLGSLPVSALAVNPASPSTLYAGTKTSGVFRSVDGAASWTAASSGLTATLIYCLAVDPKSPSTIYAGTNSGNFKSTDGATIWKAVGGPFNFLALAIDPVTPSTVYAGTPGKVFKSTDGAATWAWAGNGITVQGVLALAINPTTPSTLYAGTQDGLFKSTNAGGIWTAANTGLTALNIFALAVDPAANSTVYAGTNIGLFKSTDSGTSWTYLVNGLPETRVLALAVLPGSSTVLAGTDVGAFKSTDGGASWTQTLNLFGGFVLTFAVDPSSPSTVYAGMGIPGDTTGVVAESTDAGSTWTFPIGFSQAPLPYVNAIAVAPTSPSTIYLGTDAGAYGQFVHQHGGIEWVTNGALGSRRIFALALDPASTSTVYAGTDGGLYKSTNGGVSWTQLTNGLTATGIYAFLFDPTSASTLYAGTDSGVFKSTDGGASWSAMNQGLLNLAVNAIATTAGSPEIFYAGTTGSSVFQLGAPGTCTVSSDTLCLSGGRFQVRVAWRAVKLGTSGAGQAVALSPDTGYFWFFQSTNVELVVKVLDARGVNGKFWVFYGALSNVEYTITVTDTVTGEFQTYHNPQDKLASVADTSAFPVGGGASATTSVTEAAIARGPDRFDGGPRIPSAEPERTAACVAGPTALCLSGGRFRVEVAWRAAAQGTSGAGQAAPLTADTGYFWFFQSTNVELVVKVLDARGVNGKFWVFYGALSNVEYTITVTDTQTGLVKTYFNPQDTMASIADISAF